MTTCPAWEIYGEPVGEVYVSCVFADGHTGPHLAVVNGNEVRW